MRKTPPYSPEFRLEAVGLLRSSGRSVPQLARELGCSPQSLRNWAGQLEVDEGRKEGLRSDECEELRRLRRENRILAEERDILKKRRPSSPTTAGRGDGVRVHRRGEARALRLDAVPRARRQPLGLSRLAGPPAVSAGA